MIPSDLVYKNDFLLFIPPSQGSYGKESACNAGDLGLIPGLGRSLKKGMATHSSVLAWRIPWAGEAGGLYIVHGVGNSRT